MDTKEKIASFWRKLTDLLPGLPSYHKKESLREADKRLRVHIASTLQDLKRKIEEVQSKEVSSGRLEYLRKLDLMVSRIDMLSDTIRHAPYGYTPLGDSNPITENVLEEILENDYTLASEINRLSKTIELILNQKIDEDIINNCSLTLDSIEDAITKRAKNIQ